MNPPPKKQYITYGKHLIHYQLTYTHTPKKKITIHVYPDGLVKVDAPHTSPLTETKDAVLKRARWVLGHLKDINDKQYYVIPREYVSGETHFYLGRRYQLKVLKRKNESVKLIGGKLLVHTNDKTLHHVRNLLWQWYKDRSHAVFERRLKAMAEKLPWTKGVIPEWKLLAMKKQWGSCSPKGKLSINPHLVKASRDCIDYVLLHELCHLKEHNHSKRFYKLLNRNMSDWSTRKAKLDSMAEMLLNG